MPGKHKIDKGQKKRKQGQVQSISQKEIDSVAKGIKVMYSTPAGKKGIKSRGGPGKLMNQMLGEANRREEEKYQY